MLRRRPPLSRTAFRAVSASLWGESAEHVARHVPDTHIRELSGVGHIAPVLAPELLSEELISFIDRDG